MSLTIEQGKALVEEFCAFYPVARQIDFLVRELHEDTNERENNGQSTGPVLGEYRPGESELHRGRCYLFAGASRDADDFKETLRHEIIGHFGINTFGAEDKRAVLTAIVEARGEPDLSQLWHVVDRLYGNMADLEKAEEVYAIVCEIIAPGQQINKTVGDRGLHDVFIGRSRTMRLQDLLYISLMVADGLHDRSRSQQIFPGYDAGQYRIEKIAANGGAILLGRNTNNYLMHMEQNMRPVEMKTFVMSFAEFAVAVKPSGATNRYPSIGAGAEVFSYSVYMNGPLVASLPAHSREHEFKDVTLHALTEKLELNSGSARDNLKVAEIVALRGTWMSAVLESSMGISAGLSSQVLDDYTQLSNGMTHPWIEAELTKQRALSVKLQPALGRAGATIGRVVKDMVPGEFTVGKVVAQDLDFTMQQTHDGEVVTHENRRLNAVPEMGVEVMVSYYRGTGQVVESLANLKVSSPFVDPGSEDLAVLVTGANGGEQMVLFNSIAGFEKFVKAHGIEGDLAKSYISQAMDARAASPKAVLPAVKRELVAPPYVDFASGCLAVDYKEAGVKYSALFSSAEVMALLAKEFDLAPRAIAIAEALEVDDKFEQVLASEFDVNGSMQSLRDNLARTGFHDIQEIVDGRSYVGKVVAASTLHVAQHTGRGAVVIHDLRSLDKVAAVGDSLTVKVESGRGKVTDMVKDGKGVGR